MINVDEHTSDLIQAVKAAATARSEAGNPMAMMTAVAWASGYSGHRKIDLMVFYDALESMYREGLITSI